MKKLGCYRTSSPIRHPPRLQKNIGRTFDRIRSFDYLSNDLRWKQVDGVRKLTGNRNSACNNQGNRRQNTVAHDRRSCFFSRHLKRVPFCFFFDIVGLFSPFFSPKGPPSIFYDLDRMDEKSPWSNFWVFWVL